MRGRRATRGEQGIKVPTFRRNTSHILGEGGPVTTDLAAVDTGAWGEGLIAPYLPTVGAIIVRALGVLLGGGPVILSLVAKLRLRVCNGGRGEVVGGGRGTVMGSVIQRLITGVRELRLQGMAWGAGEGGGEWEGRTRRRGGGGGRRLWDDSGSTVKGQQGLEVAGEPLHIL